MDYQSGEQQVKIDNLLFLSHITHLKLISYYYSNLSIKVVHGYKEVGINPKIRPNQSILVYFVTEHQLKKLQKHS